MAFNFVRFSDVDSQFAARVTIRQTGQFGFNSGAINRFKLKEWSYCVLYFDAEKRVVGIELAKDRCPGAIDLKKSDTNTYIRAKNFCDLFGIDYSKSHRHELKPDPESGFLYFELDRETIEPDECDPDNDVTTAPESAANE